MSVTTVIRFYLNLEYIFAIFIEIFALTWCENDSNAQVVCKQKCMYFWYRTMTFIYIVSYNLLHWSIPQFFQVTLHQIRMCLSWSAMAHGRDRLSGQTTGHDCQNVVYKQSWVAHSIRIYHKKALVGFFYLFEVSSRAFNKAHKLQTSSFHPSVLWVFS